MLPCGPGPSAALFPLPDEAAPGPDLDQMLLAWSSAPTGPYEFRALAAEALRHPESSECGGVARLTGMGLRALPPLPPDFAARVLDLSRNPLLELPMPAPESWLPHLASDRLEALIVDRSLTARLPVWLVSWSRTRALQRGPDGGARLVLASRIGPTTAPVLPALRKLPRQGCQETSHTYALRLLVHVPELSRAEVAALSCLSPAAAHPMATQAEVERVRAFSADHPLRSGESSADHARRLIQQFPAVSPTLLAVAINRPPAYIGMMRSREKSRKPPPATAAPPAPRARQTAARPFRPWEDKPATV